MKVTPAAVRSLRRRVLRFYEKHGRDLPFRQTTNPYCITVSEIMLQQTQVDRVIPKYEQWIRQWPDWQSLSRATNRQLLATWSGLGYNRRALHLGATARIIVKELGGTMPEVLSQLQLLPGIGPYTARAILIFAHNRPLAAIDTNVRRVLIHELNLPENISGADLQDIAEQVVPERSPRKWHHALMDYGALKMTAARTRIRPLSRQSRFEGSLRQIRGEIIRQLTSKQRVATTTIMKAIDRSERDVTRAAMALAREGQVNVRGNFIYLR